MAADSAASLVLWVFGTLLVAGTIASLWAIARVERAERDAEAWLHERDRLIDHYRRTGELYPVERADTVLEIRRREEEAARRDRRRWVRDHMRPHGGLR